MHHATRIKRSATTAWMTYSGMAASFFFAASEADAQVIYTELDPELFIHEASVDIDLDGDGVTDITFSDQGHAWGNSNWVETEFALVPEGNAVIGQFQNNRVYPSVLLQSSAIAPGDLGFQEASSQILVQWFYDNTGNTLGQWGFQLGYLGCRFDINGATHYGWVSLYVLPGYAIRVYGYAYEETPDVAIYAGDEGITTGVHEHASPLLLTTAPNPTCDRVTVTFDALASGNVQLSVMNGLGQVLQVEQAAATAGRNALPIDFSALPTATYFVRLQSEGKVAYRKVTKVDR